MDQKNEKTKSNVEEISINETSFKSLYGLTPEVEQAITLAIDKNNKVELKKLG